jgi:beta-hydroxylase
MATGVLAASNRPLVWRYAKKTVKRVVPTALAIYFIPKVLAIYFCFGLLDVLRNKQLKLSTIDRYFFGNGVFTWLLSPFNLLMDVLTLPYLNKGIYRLGDLPPGHQAEIKTVIEAAQRRNIVGLLEEKMDGKPRGMIFFKWYGNNLATSVEMPEYHQRYRYIRTIGVSIFNKKQSTGRHFGPLRITLRVLYNVNTIEDREVYIQVGEQIQRWRDEKLFIFDDTLQHQSCNESEKIRYCLFVDILRPSLFPRLMSGILAAVRTLMTPYRAAFYKHWTFLK